MSYDVVQDSLESLSTYWMDPAWELDWPSVFVLPAWMRAWVDVFGDGAGLFVRTVKAGRDILGIAPLMLQEGSARFIGSTDVCDYQDFITAPGRTGEFCAAMLDDLALNGVRELDLAHVRPESIVMTVLAPLAERRGYKFEFTREDVSFELDLPATFEEYLDGLSGKQRHEVRRKLRRISAAGEPRYRTISSKADVAAKLDTFFQMFTESRQDKAEFLTERMKMFFRRIADAMAETGLLKLGVLELDSRPVAQILCFDYRGCIFLYNSGYDPATTSLSAGQVSKVMAIRDAIERGRSRFDFLKGDEVYKGHLGGREVPLYRCRITLS